MVDCLVPEGLTRLCLLITLLHELLECVGALRFSCQINSDLFYGTLFFLETVPQTLQFQLKTVDGVRLVDEASRQLHVHLRLLLQLVR